MSNREPIVVCDPDKLRGEPHVRGYNVLVSEVFRCIRRGYSEGEIEIMADFPGGTVARVIEESIEALRERGRSCGSK